MAKILKKIFITGSDQVNEFKGKIEQIFKDNNMEFTDEKFKETLTNYRKFF